MEGILIVISYILMVLGVIWVAEVICILLGYAQFIWTENKKENAERTSSDGK